MNVSLTPKLEEYTKSKISSGLYNNASEVVREALRLMIEREQDHEKLRAGITRGFQQIQDGDFTEITSKDELKAMARGKRRRG